MADPLYEAFASGWRACGAEGARGPGTAWEAYAATLDAPGHVLTDRQRDALLAIQASLDAHGRAPTFEELRRAIGTASKSSVMRKLRALKERGFIRRHPGRARAIQVVRRIDVAEAAE